MLRIVEYGLQNKIHPISLLHKTCYIQNQLHKSLLNQYAYYPMVFAVYTNNIVCVDLLIQKGATENLESSARTAAWSGNLKIIETLLRAGADIRECYHSSNYLYGRQSKVVRIFQKYVKIYGYDDE